MAVKSIWGILNSAGRLDRVAPCPPIIQKLVLDKRGKMNKINLYVNHYTINDFETLNQHKNSWATKPVLSKTNISSIAGVHFNLGVELGLSLRKVRDEAISSADTTNSCLQDNKAIQVRGDCFDRAKKAFALSRNDSCPQS